jgi:hypothetical protein
MSEILDDIGPHLRLTRISMGQLTPPQARRIFQDRLVFTLGLRRKPLRLFCEHCGMFIPSDLMWLCGYCNHENVRTKLYSFLYKCQKCKQPPKALVCPHCEKIIFIDGSKDGRHAARKAGAMPIDTEDEARLRKARLQEERKADLEHEIVVTRLNAELAALKKTLEPPKKKLAHEALEENFSEHDAHVMAAHKIAKREKEENKRKYADDPELLARADASVDNWLERHV